MTIPQAFELALQRHQAGRLADADALYRQILAAEPNHAGALHLLGVTAHQTGHHGLAVEWIRQGIASNPNIPAAHSNLGEAYRAMGRLDEAIASYRRALELRPDYPEACNNLGIALRQKGRFGEAIAAYRRALELKPDYAEAQNNLGAAMARQGQLDEAVAAHRRALELKPDFPEAHNNLGNALKAQGELDEAIAAYRQALRLKPEDARFHSNLVYTLHFHPGYNEREIAEERQRWNRQFGEPAKRFFLPHANDPATAGRLRIGYVSPDFRDHVVGRNLLPLFEQHDRAGFEILCYSGVVQPDELTGRFRRCADQWRSTVGVGDEAFAEMIRRDGVDILVDLTQHMEDNRLPVFARRPAPVQVSFAGYPEDTGLEAIEYRISDRYLEGSSAGEAGGRAAAGSAVAGHSETGLGEASHSIRMIDSFWCYDPCGIEVEVNGLPAMGSGRVTFGCLNNTYKVNEPVLRLWAQALGRVKDSRLVILCRVGSHRQRILEVLAREGVEGRRVEFVEFRPRREYLELYHRLDIVLDTFPYNGHTTSLDALWMGVPVVSLAGNAPVSRAGLSQLTNLGLPELAAHSESEYVNIAESLAMDLPRLAALRSSLRDRMKASVLMDAPRFARQVEQAYREMWRKWGGGQALEACNEMTKPE